MNDFNQIFNLQSWQEIIQLNLTPWRLFIAIVDISLITFLIYKKLSPVLKFGYEHTTASDKINTAQD